jgi:hypothetical protein
VRDKHRMDIKYATSAKFNIQCTSKNRRGTIGKKKKLHSIKFSPINIGKNLLLSPYRLLARLT